MKIWALLACILFSSASYGKPVSKEQLQASLAAKFETQLERQAILLSWDADYLPGIKGYNVYYGNESKKYPYKEFVAGTKQLVMSRVSTGKPYYFAVAAVDKDGVESELSEELMFFGGYITRVQNLDKKNVLTIKGAKGWYVNIAMSRDAKTWTLLKSVKSLKPEYDMSVRNLPNETRYFWMIPQN